MTVAYQCFKLALASNNNHAESYNNLGVLELRKANNEQVVLLPDRDKLPRCATFRLIAKI